MAFEHTVENDDDGIRLDRWFKRHCPGFPHSMLEKCLRKGQVRVDGKKAQANERITAGQVISYPDMVQEAVQAPKPKKTVSENDLAEIRKWVIYRDSNLIVINKPHGLAVQGGTKIIKSVDGLLDGLMFDAKVRPKLVHRLDRDTSGVLVLGRSSKAAAHLAKGFLGKDIEKVYLALVVGVPQPLNGKINLPLSKADMSPGYERMGVDEDEGKTAITEYRVLDSLARKYALVELKPITGRMHQLRVHMEAIGCPIVGDPKYGNHSNNAIGLGVSDSLHLHARRIIIPAFGGEKKVDISAPLPPHMQKSFKALGIDIPK